LIAARPTTRYAPRAQEAQMDSESNPENPKKKMTTKAILASSVFLTAPSLILFYYAMQLQGSLRWVLIATGFVVAICNALMLVLIRNWITRHLQS